MKAGFYSDESVLDGLAAIVLRDSCYADLDGAASMLAVLRRKRRTTG